MRGFTMPSGNGPVVTEESHLDHVPRSVVQYVLNECMRLSPDRVRHVDLDLLPALPTVTRSLVGPACGDLPVLEEEVFYARRGDRAYESRLIARQPVKTRIVRAVFVPERARQVLERIQCQYWMVLKTVYGIGRRGEPLAPPEPDDPKCTDRAASRQFWSQHALCA